MQVRASSAAGPGPWSESLYIETYPVDDSAPIFFYDAVVIELYDNTPPGALFGERLLARYEGDGIYLPYTMSLSGPDANLFTTNYWGHLALLDDAVLDAATRDSYTFTLHAEDTHGDVHEIGATDSVDVMVRVLPCDAVWCAKMTATVGLESSQYGYWVGWPPAPRQKAPPVFEEGKLVSPAFRVNGMDYSVFLITDSTHYHYSVGAHCPRDLRLGILELPSYGKLAEWPFDGLGLSLRIGDHAFEFDASEHSHIHIDSVARWSKDCALIFESGLTYDLRISTPNSAPVIPVSYTHLTLPTKRIV